MGINSIDNQYYNAFLPAKQAATSSVDNPIKEELQISFGDTKNIESDVFEKEENTPADGKDDGSIGFWGALKSFGKGALNFFKGMVCDENGKFSLKQTLKTAGMIAGIGLLTLVPVIGPLVLPALCIYGIYEGGKIAYEGAQKAYNATTDAEAEQAWEEIGTGTTEGILSVAGYKATGGIKAAFGKSKAQFMSIKNRFSKAPEPPLELAEKTSPSEAASAENSTTSRSVEESSATTSTTEEVATQKTTATRTPEEVAEKVENTSKNSTASPKYNIEESLEKRPDGTSCKRCVTKTQKGKEISTEIFEYDANGEIIRYTSIEKNRGTEVSYDYRTKQYTVKGAKYQTEGGVKTKTVTYDVKEINAEDIYFTQQSMGENYANLVDSFREHGWQGKPVDIIRTKDGKYISIDNRRIAAAREAGIDVHAVVHDIKEPLTMGKQRQYRIQNPETQEVIEMPKTWGEAIYNRLFQNGLISSDGRVNLQLAHNIPSTEPYILLDKLKLDLYNLYESGNRPYREEYFN